jgi:hypothetical protein
MGNRILAIVSLPKKLFLGPSKEVPNDDKSELICPHCFQSLTAFLLGTKIVLGTNKYVIKAINMLP